MPSSSDVRERSIKEEVAMLASTLNDVQIRLQQVLTRLDAGEQVAETGESREEELEKELREAVNSAKWLRMQNAELEERLAQHKPELEQALSGREHLLRKLKHARKVIRDLLQERGDLSPRTQGFVTQEEIEEALDGDIRYDRDSESSSSSSSSEPPSDVDSDRTVRLTSAGVASPAQTFTGTPQVAHTSHLSPGPSAIRSDNGSIVSDPIRSPQTPIANQPASVSQRPSPNPSTSRSSPETWHIHFKKPPGSSILQEGPMDLAKLQICLRLDQDAMNSLRSLENSIDLSMRLQIIRLQNTKVGPVNCAFLYDPLFVEARQKSYVLEWGRQPTNQNIEKYISQHKGVDLVFHVFTYPVNENSWFYIGAHNWSVVQITDFWHPLERKSRRKIIQKLCNRSHGEVDETELGRLLDSGELKQFCVELTAVADASITYNFAARILGRQSSVHGETRRERRAEGVME